MFNAKTLLDISEKFCIPLIKIFEVVIADLNCDRLKCYG